MLRLAAIALTSLAAPAFAFAPAQVLHTMTGRMLPSGNAESRVALRINCIFYEEGPDRGRGAARRYGVTPHLRDPRVGIEPAGWVSS